MVVGQFLEWVEAAPVGRRAEAARALALACLESRPNSSARGAIEAAITLLLEEARSDVRQAFAEAFAASDQVPRHIVVTLAADQVSIAAPVLARSPLFLDGELLDLLPGAPEALQTAIASRRDLSTAVASAIAEIGGRSVCLALIGNRHAAIDAAAYARIADRFPNDPDVRESLLARPGLPPEIHQGLVRRVADALATMVVSKAWVSETRAITATRDACDRATVAIASAAEALALPHFVEHLRASGQLTTALILRAVCAGNLDFFEAALAALATVPVERVASLVGSRRLGGLQAVYSRAGLPEVAFGAFAAALDIWAEVADEGDATDDYRTPGEVAEAILARYANIAGSEGSDVSTMLRRFTADQARAAAHEVARAAA